MLSLITKSLNDIRQLLVGIRNSAYGLFLGIGLQTISLIFHILKNTFELGFKLYKVIMK
jgi:hypothetical protein